MTRQEFADKWGYQSGVGYGCAQFDCRESLLKDLNVLIADEVKNLALPQVSKCEDVEREALLLAYAKWRDEIVIHRRLKPEELVKEFLSKQ